MPRSVSLLLAIQVAEMFAVLLRLLAMPLLAFSHFGKRYPGSRFHGALCLLGAGTHSVCRATVICIPVATLSLALPVLWVILLGVLPFQTNHSLKSRIWGFLDLAQRMDRGFVLVSWKSHRVGACDPLSVVHTAKRVALNECVLYGVERQMFNRLFVKSKRRNPSLRSESLFVF